MIRVAICDDENYYLNEITSMVFDIAKKNNILIDIHTFSSGKDLLNFLYDDVHYFDLFLLDIIMDGICGIDLGKFIRDNNSYSEIILITTSMEYIFDGYDIDASNYLLKPLCIDKLEVQFLKSIKKIDTVSSNYIVVKNNSNISKIATSCIIFFESKLRKILIHTTFNEELVLYEKLDSIYDKVSNKYFIRCHKSYIVNLEHIKEIKDNNIITSNYATIPISRPYLKSTKDSFLNFFINNI